MYARLRGDGIKNGEILGREAKEDARRVDRAYTGIREALCNVASRPVNFSTARKAPAKRHRGDSRVATRGGKGQFMIDSSADTPKAPRQ